MTASVLEQDLVVPLVRSEHAVSMSINGTATEEKATTADEAEANRGLFALPTEQF